MKERVLDNPTKAVTLTTYDYESIKTFLKGKFGEDGERLQNRLSFLLHQINRKEIFDLSTLPTPEGKIEGVSKNLIEGMLEARKALSPFLEYEEDFLKRD